MAVFPTTVVPSMVSAPAIIDPKLSFRTDAGYEVRRAQTSRPRRRWTLEFLGKTTDEMRQIRDFLQQMRLGALDFGWFHPTQRDPVLYIPSTPCILAWRHALFSGQWVFVRDSPHPGLNEHIWQVTYFDPITVTLNGTGAAGISGVGWVYLYVPHAVGIFQEDTFPSPATLIGPEQVAYGTQRSGYFNFTVTIEEVF